MYVCGKKNHVNSSTIKSDVAFTKSTQQSLLLAHDAAAAAAVVAAGAAGPVPVVRADAGAVRVPGGDQQQAVGGEGHGFFFRGSHCT